MLRCLSISRRGLSNFELCKLIAVENEEEVESLLESELGDLVIRLDLQWNIAWKEFKREAKRKLVPEGEEIKLHQAIVKSYRITLEHSIPLLDEKIHHMYKGKDYSGLKQFLSDIEHFLLFYTPYFKLTLFHYWSLLEHAGFEPVTEYVRSLEGYESRAGLTSLDLLKVILQLSRFFKELADFESEATPQFRHPKVLNKHTVRGERTDPKYPAPPTNASTDPFGTFFLIRLLAFRLAACRLL